MMPYWAVSLVGAGCFFLGLVVAAVLANNRVIDLEEKVSSLYGRIADLEQARIRKGMRT
jgi:hypothetical protein